jgi:serine/threonine protein phosphatase 1
MSRFIIGDIHGCVDELRHLIDGLPLAGDDRVVFLGDYIDRGPASKDVVSFLLSLSQKHVKTEFIFLKGNHEDMLLSYLGFNGAHGDMFIINGGKATLASYGLDTGKMTPQDALQEIPAEHLQFYQGLKSYYLMDSFLCVHAGIDPQKALADQTNEELFWIRNKFIYSSHKMPHTVLFGHTPQHSVLYDLPYKVGLDTGLVYGNMLTCLELDEKVLFQISRGKKGVNKTSVQRIWNSPARVLR